MKMDEVGNAEEDGKFEIWRIRGMNKVLVQ